MLCMVVNIDSRYVFRSSRFLVNTKAFVIGKYAMVTGNANT